MQPTSSVTHKLAWSWSTQRLPALITTYRLAAARHPASAHVNKALTRPSFTPRSRRPTPTLNTEDRQNTCSLRVSTATGNGGFKRWRSGSSAFFMLHPMLKKNGQPRPPGFTQQYKNTYPRLKLFPVAVVTRWYRQFPRRRRDRCHGITSRRSNRRCTRARRHRRSSDRRRKPGCARTHICHNNLLRINTENTDRFDQADGLR